MNQTTIGERLRQAREAVPASVAEASRETKIRIDFLQAMERDSFRFAWATYVKGMLRAYARWLGLDDEELAGEYERMYGEGPGPSVRQIFKEPAERAPRRRSPRWMIAAALAASTLLGLSLIGVMNPPGPTKVAPPPPAPAGNGGSGQAAGSGPAAIAEAPAVVVVQVVVTVVGKKCWTRVLADGSEKPLFEGNLFSGAVQTFQANQRLEILFGNLGAVQIRVNGRDLGSPGEPGKTGKFVFTADTTSFVRPPA